ncbi:MAG TPA: twin-arginine translocase TatA/TatE family subunit [Acidobacteriaceae bacterium]|nr:twin-arginine translocase TatA/TatE family subunit [Acidobacteriaceae bacterium]
MHFGDSIFIFLLALVLFGPKKLPEIGRQVGKLLAEFRRASNEFKFQIQEEIRQMEDEERRKKLEESRAAAAAAPPASSEIPPPPEIVASPQQESSPAVPTIQPPSTGETVSTARPFATPAESEPQPPAAEATLSPADLLQQTPEVAAGGSNGTHASAAEVSEEESVHHD